MISPISADDLERCEDALRIASAHGTWDSDLAAKIRSLVGEDLAAVVLVSLNLQSKARAKLGEGIWWCTERSLSQATPAPVAELKARWMNSRSVLDGCCGLGADTLAIAKMVGSADVQVTAVDSDPMMVAMTRENLRMNLQPARPQVAVRHDDVAAVPIAADATVHLDPDRRDDRGRKVRPEDYSPPWAVVERILDRCAAGIVKLAPAAVIEDRPQRHRLWVSLGGSVREQTLLTGQAIDRAAACFGHPLIEASRTAVLVRPDGSAVTYTVAGDSQAGRRVEKPMQYLADPDAAIRAAGLTESFAGQYGYDLLGGPSGFLTGDTAIESDLAICEPVIWSGACDDRRLRKTLRSMNCYPWRVKTRGVSQNPNMLEKRYRQCGERPVTLWIGKGPRRQFAALTVPADSPRSDR
ncbi:methyltransferase domain-containing protein [Stieleria sp. ICT_E10.1]|uniref:class I SAM-dependent methyltransferase n=1 Tax=Stieleria sedimenti TaxID=2976331 RepID=UPI0021805A57|nr:class I SAM-dependent methyltransferase [Stieleria sedimenti]MCS7468319.1 methyltransferase domain-containing protein [Stieleria sedimenti]